MHTFAKNILLGSTLIMATGAMAAPFEERFPISITELENKQQARFDRIDVDGNKMISLAEFESAKLQRHGPKGAHRDRPHSGKGERHAGSGGFGPRALAMREAVKTELFNLMDTDGDGTLSRAEHAAGDQPKNRQLARKRASFKFLDSDNSGTLSINEMPAPAAHLRAADTDGDGMITAEEMRAHRASRRQQKAG
jgi:Ca2+-binding EF-hand superfamily protein